MLLAYLLVLGTFSTVLLVCLTSCVMLLSSVYCICPIFQQQFRTICLVYLYLFIYFFLEKNVPVIFLTLGHFQKNLLVKTFIVLIVIIRNVTAVVLS